jgi:hypothetical protein
MPIGKSANAAYKEYRHAGGTLSFPAYLEQEKNKISTLAANGEQDVLIIDRPLNDSVQQAIQHALAGTGTGVQTTADNSRVLGIKKPVLIGIGILLIGGLTAYIIVKNKKA